MGVKSSIVRRRTVAKTMSDVERGGFDSMERAFWTLSAIALIWELVLGPASGAMRFEIVHVDFVWRVVGEDFHVGDGDGDGDGDGVFVRVKSARAYADPV
jgi:hypothetical protein